MYVKIKEYLDAKGVFPKRGAGDLIVPTRNHVFETNSIEYKKVRVTSKKELDDALLGITDYCVIGYLPELCNCEGAGKECNLCASFEFIIVTMEKHGNYIANGELFLMNEQGKTIDSLVCH